MDQSQGATAQSGVTILATDALAEWLTQQQVSLALTTYQAGKLFFIGRNDAQSLSVFERSLDRVMGLNHREQTLWVSTTCKLWRLENMLPPGAVHEGCDRLYVPREARVTGDLDVHDLVVEDGGRVVFVNTLFNCLATVDDHYHFRPIWKPPWIDDLVAQDRCHLNGVAMRDGRIRYASAVCTSNEEAGWRNNRIGTGVIVDVSSDEIVCDGLTMPHSPRWHAGRIWVLDSGTGRLGYVNDAGRFEPIASLPGFARGLAILGHHALIGLSRRRDNERFRQLPLARRLKEAGLSTRCGIWIVDLRTGQTLHHLEFKGAVRELYDVAILPGVRRPMAIGFQTDEIERIVSHPPLGSL